MFDTTSKSSELTMAMYGSPLRKPGVGWLLAAALVALIGLALWQLTHIFEGVTAAHMGVFFVALLGATAISIIPVLILRWLDRREPEPWFMYAVAFLWGGLIATGIAANLNSYATTRVGGLLGMVLAAPLIEETAKGLGLLVLVLVLRSEFDGPRDGFIYGALIGLGFDWLECSVYVAQEFHKTGVPPWQLQLGSRYALLGFNGHALYTGITGTFIGFSLLRKSRLKRVALTLTGYLLAVFSHITWNSAGVLVSAMFSGLIGMSVFGKGNTQALAAQVKNVPFWMSWPANLGATLVVNFIGYLVVIVGLRRSGRWERTIMAEQLIEEVRSSVVTAEEYANIQGRCEPPRGGSGRGIFTAQCNLAKRKSYLGRRGLPVDSDPIVMAWRNKVPALRDLTPIR